MRFVQRIEEGLSAAFSPLAAKVALFLTAINNDLPVGHERLGHPNRHLGVVGLPDFFLRVCDERFDAGEAGADGQSVLALELAT